MYCTSRVSVYKNLICNFMVFKVLRSLMDTFWKSSEYRLPRTKEPQLVRDWIKESLYTRSDSYFEKTDNIREMEPINFNELRDQEEYDACIQNNYASCGGNWHTPSELFKPHYGKAIMNSLNTCSNVIYELGPGTGALCQSILPLYKGEYHLIEVSQTLHTLQRSKFAKSANVKCHLGYDELKKDNRACTVLACEVFDNLPHDLVRIEADGSISQGMIVTNDEATFRDVPGRYYFEFQPLTDPLIIEYLNAVNIELKSVFRERFLQGAHNVFPEYVYPRNCQFIPTAAFSLLIHLYNLLPNANLMIFDFDRLPGQISLGQATAPVVQTVYKGETINSSKLLVKPGLFDIFFPTDFSLLQQLIERQFWPNHKVMISKHGEFMKEHADLKSTTLMNGFNPLLHTFKNVSILRTEPK